MRKSELMPIEMVTMLNRTYAYTLEEISKIIKVPIHKTKALVEDALAQELLEFQDFELERGLTKDLVQVKRVRYYKRIF